MSKPLLTLTIPLCLCVAGVIGGFAAGKSAVQQPPQQFCRAQTEFVSVSGDICGATVIDSYSKTHGSCSPLTSCTHNNVEGLVDLCSDDAVSMQLTHASSTTWISGTGPWISYCESDPHSPGCGESVTEELLIENMYPTEDGSKVVRLKCTACPQ